MQRSASIAGETAAGPGAAGIADMAPWLPTDWPNRSASRALQVAGKRWHLQQMGSGPSLLLIHGTAASVHSWRDLMPHLAAHYAVTAIDLPGHGFTERRPGESMSLPAVARAVADCLEAAAVTPRYVVGHSAGAAIALQMAFDGTVKPDSIVGLNAALLPFGGALQKLFAPLARFFAGTRLMPTLLARRAGDIEAVRRVLRSTGSEIDAAGVAQYQLLLRREQHVAAVLAMMADWRLQDLLDKLGQLHAALHLITGERDTAVSPGEARRVAAALPGCTVVPMPHCGHLAHEEDPRQAARLIHACCAGRSTAGC